MKRWLTPTLAVVFGFASADCGPGTENAIDQATCGLTVFNPSTGTFTTVGSNAAALKVNAFLRATLDLNTAVNNINTEMDTACRAVATDLGITDIPTDPNVPSAVNSCGRVEREIRTILQTALPAGARLVVDVQPAVCQVDLNVSAQCTAQCTGRAMVEVPRCTGEVVAQCTGSCSGSCSGSCTGGCNGMCTGTCSGSCTGTCHGQCAGTCSVPLDGTGNCHGSCTGTCTGSCSGGCTGSCSGGCTAQCQGSCMGECRGTCSAASSVRCDGRADVNVDVQCDAACEAQANARATCTDPQVNLSVNATVDPAARARLDTLVTSLRRNYPRFLAVGRRITLLVEGGYVTNFADTVRQLPSALGEAGITAVACVGRAATVVADAALKLQATATVTVNVTASVTVSGGGS